MSNRFFSKSLLLFFSLLFVHIANAQTGPALKLGDNMKKMKNALVDIATGLNDPTKVVGLADRAVDFRLAAADSLRFTPDTIASNPNLKPDEKRQAQIDFEREVVSLLPLSLDLETALLKGDVATASTLLTQLDQTKKDGHKKFK